MRGRAVSEDCPSTDANSVSCQQASKLLNHRLRFDSFSRKPFRAWRDTYIFLSVIKREANSELAKWKIYVGQVEGNPKPPYLWGIPFFLYPQMFTTWKLIQCPSTVLEFESSGLPFFPGGVKKKVWALIIDVLDDQPHPEAIQDLFFNGLLSINSKILFMKTGKPWLSLGKCSGFRFSMART